VDPFFRSSIKNRLDIIKYSYKPVELYVKITVDEIF